MADIDFEAISPTSPQSGDAFVTRRGGGAPYSGALILTADMLARANHTGTQTASTISDFATAVAATAAVTANTAKVSNATHTGDVTGATALTIDPAAITGKSAVTAVGADYVLISDTSDSGNLKKALVSDFAGGAGDVTAAAAFATDNLLIRSDGTGKGVQASTIGLDDAGGMKFPTIATPATPAAGNLTLFAKSLASRALPAVIGPSGLETTLQPGLSGNRVLFVSPTSGTTAPSAWGGNVGVAGTASFQQTFGSTNRWLSTARKRYTSAGTAGSGGGVRQAYLNWMRGSAAGFGGFFFRAQVGMSINLNGSACFVGLCTATGALAGSPTTDIPTNMCGMGWDTGDADTGNWQFFRNDGTGSPTKVDLGATNAARAVDVGWELNMFVAPGGSDLFVHIINLNTGATVIDTSYSTDIPAADTGMALKCDIYNGAIASACNIEWAKVYIETDY